MVRYAGVFGPAYRQRAKLRALVPARTDEPSGGATVVAGSGHTVTEDFLDVRPVREVPALASKQLSAMDGTRCKEICASKRDWDSINYCVIATIDANPHFQCRVRRSGGTAPGYAFDVLVDIPPSVDLATLPARTAYDSGPLADLVVADERLQGAFATVA